MAEYSMMTLYIVCIVNNRILSQKLYQVVMISIFFSSGLSSGLSLEELCVRCGIPVGWVDLLSYVRTCSDLCSSLRQTIVLLLADVTVIQASSLGLMQHNLSPECRFKTSVNAAKTQKIICDRSHFVLIVEQQSKIPLNLCKTCQSI